MRHELAEAKAMSLIPQEVLTLDDLRSWTQALPEQQVIGAQGIARACPLARYLGDRLKGRYNQFIVGRYAIIIGSEDDDQLEIYSDTLSRTIVAIADAYPTNLEGRAITREHFLSILVSVEGILQQNESVG